MTPWLQIIIPVATPGPELAAMVASLKAQTDRDFGVLLCGNGFSEKSPGWIHWQDALKELSEAGLKQVTHRSPQFDFKLARLEFWNWTHTQAEAEWVKPLLPGACLEPTYVAKLRQRIAERPDAKFIRCDARFQTEWGLEVLPAPTDLSAIRPMDFLNLFPAKVNWLGSPLNVAYRRVAWQALGGYSVHLPVCAPLNLNALLALHHGLENIAECLVTGAGDGSRSLNENGSGRVNLSLELWLVMRQLRNYCLAARLPWPRGGVACGVWRGQPLLAG